MFEEIREAVSKTPKSSAQIREEARRSYEIAQIRHIETERAEQGKLPMFSFMWWLMLVWNTFMFLVKRARTTLIWLVGFNLVPRAAFLAVCVLAVTWAIARFRGDSRARQILPLLPIIGDWIRYRRDRRREKETSLGNDLLRDFRIVEDTLLTQDVVYPAAAREIDGVLFWTFSIGRHGATRERIQKHLEEGLSIVGAADYRLEQIDNSTWEVRFFKEQQPWFLDQAQELAEPLPAEFSEKGEKQRVRVPVFFTENNEQRTIDLDGVAGMVIGGLPGSGKSALLNTLLAPLLATDLVEVSIFDGKGGADLRHFEPYAGHFSNDDRDLDGLIEFLEKKLELLRHRVHTNKERTGDSNFWHTGLSAKHPAQVIVIDECQNYLDSSGDSKEDKQKKEKIVALVTDLVKKGRSAGFTTILSTQKPDSQSVPTKIRDNCTRRIAFRVTTPEMTTMILGAQPEDAPAPTEIPNARKGGAIIASDEGEWEAVRAFYISERNLEEWLAKHAVKKELKQV